MPISNLQIKIPSLSAKNVSPSVNLPPPQNGESQRAVARRCGTFVEERLPQHPCQAFVKEGAGTWADRSHTRSRAEDGSTIHLAVFLLGS